MASAWVLEAVKADIAARIAIVAPFIPANTLDAGVFSEVQRVYWDTGNVLQGPQIDKYVSNEIKVLQAINKLPADVVQQIPAELQIPSISQQPRGEKRPLPSVECKDGKCYKISRISDKQRERPPPLREGASSPIFGKPFISFECPLEDSCYIKDYQEKLDAASALVKNLDDEEPVRAKSPSVVSIDSDRTLTDIEMLG
jgi:hypothetical protein